MKTNLGKTDTGRIRAFTLIELLVVIGIIALLIGILLPVISKVRIKGHVADTQHFISQISASVEQYHTDQRAYPGPISNLDIYNATPSSGTTIKPITTQSQALGFDITPANLNNASITMSENLVLGLCGGLVQTGVVGASVISYNPALVGQGPMNLNPANPKRFPPYIDAVNLDWQSDPAGPPGNNKSGHYFDDAAAASDTMIPEFLDRFPDGMPILYMRARVGQPVVLPTATGYGGAFNSVITDLTTNNRLGQYDLSQIIGYTEKQTNGSYIGVSKTLKPGDYINPTNPGPTLPHGLATVNVNSTFDKTNTANYSFPYDAFIYFQNPNSPNTPRQRDGYILISPGPDRVYGTPDDIDSFGDVLP